MPKAYSLDLRQRVLSCLKSGNSVAKTIDIFSISRPTIFRWIHRNKNNALAPLKNSVRKPQKLNPVELQEYINQNPDLTIEQIAQHFNVYANAVFYRIKKMKLTYKKKSFFTKNEMKKDGQNSRS